MILFCLRPDTLWARSDKPCFSCTINGPSSVVVGQTAIFTLSGCSAATSWTVSCGTINSSSSASITINFTGVACTSVIITARNATTTLVSTTIPVQPASPLLGGSFPQTHQFINYNTVITNFPTASGSTGGTCSGGFTYQWDSSKDNINFYPISLATNANYTPGALTTTTYYERETFCSGYAAWTSNTDTVTVYPKVVAGPATPTTQTIFTTTTPGLLSITGTSGGNLSYTYQWQSCTSSSFSSITNVGTNTTSYQPPLLSTTTFYRVAVTSNGSTPAYSDTMVINVYPPFVAGSITPASPTCFYGLSPTTPLSVAPTGGSGAYGYQWYTNASGSYQSITGATSASYLPPPATQNISYYVIVSCAGTTSQQTASVTVVVKPYVVAGYITPSSASIPSGTSPGNLSVSGSSGGGCAGNFLYQWQSSTDNATWSNISGATTRLYNPGTLTALKYYRVQAICGTDTAFTASVPIYIGTAVQDMNYIRTRTFSRPGLFDTTTAGGVTSPFDVQQVTQYLDGLGRPIQTVNRQASPLQKDMVNLQIYDPFGREAVKYLPYTSPSNDGNYKTDGFGEQNTFNASQFPTDQYFYGQTAYEASPVDRPLVTYSPGNSWVGSVRGVGQQYLLNTATDSVHIWNITLVAGSLPTDGGFYSNGMLEKNISTDEQGNQTIAYVDKDKHTILKKVQVATSPGTAHVGWLCTYYVYDDLENLRFVLSPNAVAAVDNGGTWTISTAIANELCFRYEYDARNRMIIKKVPGAGEVHMVYDSRDRLVMSQDSNMRASKQWLVTVYDAINRQDSTGMITDPTNYNNQAYHLTQAMTGGEYPNWASYTNQLLTRTFYDDYTGISAFGILPPTMATNKTSNSSYFIATYGAGPVYAVPINASPITRGLVTGTAGAVFTPQWNGQFIYAEQFYDDRGRLIQTQSVNVTFGSDTVTNQYNFSGKILRTLLGQQNTTKQNQFHQVLTKNNYDAGFRLTSIYKNIDGATADQLIDSMRYDELGQLRTKNLGKDPATGMPLDSLVFDYNIRGWVTGINKDYVGGTTNHYFGMQLGYDNPTSIASGTSYSPLYNGNIAGTVWKSAGDGVNRKYDFSYDNANRLIGAAYTDNLNGGSWGASKMDFSTYGLKYDANGNILFMNQNGFKVGYPTNPIDLLTYSYQPNSNKLSGVVDAANDSASTLGDFHYKPSTKGSSDYTYDGNGNLTQDANKGVNIDYNYMNLPADVSKGINGTVLYSYDAFGNKLSKVVETFKPTPQIVTTLYLGGLQYLQKQFPSQGFTGLDSLQFVGTEEGRARWAYHKHLAGDTAYGYEYDFIERDHLGDERVILSQEKDTAQYMCTMEPQYRATENALFYNVDSVSYPAASVTGISGGFPAPPNGPAVNDSVVKLDGNGPKMGPAIILKVMAGDKVTMGTYYYYNPLTSTPTSPLTAQNLVSSLVSGLATLSPIAQEGSTVLSGSSSSALQAALTSVSSNDTGSLSSRPQAYLNWVSMDNQFNPVTGSLQNGALQVKTAGPNGTGLQSPLGQTITVLKSGYLYIYLSNTSQGWPVFFDNFSVLHYSSPLIEENHYYPFGLGMAGISDEAIKSQYAENKYRYNGGAELQNKEFSDGSGLEVYETKLRTLDPQIGRWWQVDPKTDESYESVSPYTSMNNDPIRFSDRNGDEGEACCKAALNAVKQFGVDLYNTAVGDVRVFNTYANPVTPFVEAVTGKSVESDFQADKSRTQSALEAGITLIPLGKAAEVIAKVGEKVAEKVGEEAVAKTAFKTSVGTEVTGFTKHGVNQAIERGVKTGSIKDALKNPLKVGKVVVDKLGRESQRYVGKTAETVINPTTGKIVSVNPTSTKKVARLIKQAGK